MPTEEASGANQPKRNGKRDGRFYNLQFICLTSIIN